ncbi:hypothetical protein RYZ26_15530 [Terasakiella sp. A23]|uniref:4'-phosphopantetheinyl transferase family protein n=1 Tax=Terasakiella sp. FCG-A23 TaxID=3080561 RepID=UPI0029558D0D|nr:hypothetical protein [Terasakiella sp. A23]MDV7341017.1 hypothetical protein [Terasakiella sp. A23]
MLKIARTYLTDPKTTERIAQWCEEEDILYARRFKKNHRKQQSLTARYLIRFVFQKYWQTRSQDLKISTGENGEILLHLQTAEIHLWASISHSQNLVCIALSDDGPIGIDTEFCDPDRDILKLVSNFYPDFSGGLLCAYKFWTLNEAYGKASGQGLDFSKAKLCYQIARGALTDPRFNTAFENDYVIATFTPDGKWVEGFTDEFQQKTDS